MFVAKWLLPALAFALGGCDGNSGGKCSSKEGAGEANGVAITHAGEAQRDLGETVCIGGGDSGFTVSFKFGTLGPLQVTAALDLLGGTSTCGDKVSATLVDSPANAGEYNPNANWWAPMNTTAATCTLTAARSGDKVSGHFDGHLARRKDAFGSPDEFLDVEFDYWIKFTKE